MKFFVGLMCRGVEWNLRWKFEENLYKSMRFVGPCGLFKSIIQVETISEIVTPTLIRSATQSRVDTLKWPLIVADSHSPSLSISSVFIDFPESTKK
jgi:hypothetical protein